MSRGRAPRPVEDVERVLQAPSEKPGSVVEPRWSRWSCHRQDLAAVLHPYYQNGPSHGTAHHTSRRQSTRWVSVPQTSPGRGPQPDRDLMRRATGGSGLGRNTPVRCLRRLGGRLIRAHRDAEPVNEDTQDRLQQGADHDPLLPPSGAGSPTNAGGYIGQAAELARRAVSHRVTPPRPPTPSVVLRGVTAAYKGQR
jgi:hypothetical protein